MLINTCSFPYLSYSLSFFIFPIPPPLDSLQGSALGDAGGAALARALRHNHTLSSLSLRGCGLGAEGLKAVARALVENRGLTSLDIRCVLIVVWRWVLQV